MADAERITITLTGVGPVAGARLNGRAGAFHVTDTTVAVRLSTSSSPNGTGLMLSTDSGDTWSGDHDIDTNIGTVWEMAEDQGNSTYVAYRVNSSEMQTRRYNSGTDNWDTIADTAITESSANVNGIVVGGVFKAVFRNSAAGTHHLWFFSGSESQIVDDDGTYGTLSATNFGVEFDDDGFAHVFFSSQNSPDRQDGGSNDLDTIYHMHNRSGSFSTPVAVKTDIEKDHNIATHTTIINGGDGKMYLPIVAFDASDVNRIYLCEYDITGGTWSDNLVDSDWFENGSLTMAMQVDQRGYKYILAIGEVTSVAAFAQVYLFEDPNTGTFSRETVAQSVQDVGNSGTARIANGQRDNMTPEGAFWVVATNWDSGTVEYFFVKKDLDLIGSNPGAPSSGFAVAPPLPEVPRRNRIPFDIPTTDARQIQKPKILKELPREEREDAIQEFMDHSYEYLRAVPNDLSSRITVLAESVPGDRRDEFDIVSRGDAEEEIVVQHGLGYTPRNIAVISKSNYGDVIHSRSDALADAEAFYIKTSCPPGTRIRIRVY